VVPYSTIAARLLSVGVAATNASTVVPPSSMASMASPSVVLAEVASPFSSSRPRVSLDHLYNSSDANSL